MEKIRFNDDKKHEQIQLAQLTLQGMHCSACAVRIEKSLSKQPGVMEAAVSFPYRTAWIKYNKQLSDHQTLKNSVHKLGFAAKDQQSLLQSMLQEKKWLFVRLIASLLLSVPLLVGMIFHFPLLYPIAAHIPVFILQPGTQLVLAFILQFIVAMPFYFGAFHAVKQRKANMDVLVVLGTGTAFLYSHYLVFKQGLVLSKFELMTGSPLFFETSAAVITAILFGKYLELSASIKAMETSDMLQEKALLIAKVHRDDQWIDVHSQFLRKNERVLIQAGDTVAADGFVLEGEASVNEALLTGESIARAKTAGDKVYAGTICTSGTLTYETQYAGHNSFAAQIEELARESQLSKTTIERMADQIAAYFVPVIIIIAIGTFIGNIVLGAGDLGESLQRMIAVLLAACPCAVGLAAPLSIVISSGHLRKRGILVKEGGALERLSKIDTWIVDKTGTLTRGTPELTHVQSWNLNWTKEELVASAAAVEELSNHPLALAIRSKAIELGKTYKQAANITIAPHGGVKGYIKGCSFVIGNLNYMSIEGVSVPERAQAYAHKAEADGHTVLYVGNSRQLAAIFLFRDELRGDAKEVLEAMQSAQIDTILATGDQAAAARSVAEELSIKQFFSCQTAVSKLELVQKFKAEGKRVVMTGDGWNDSPALAAATVGIAMGNGAGAALNAGHIVLLHGKLQAMLDLLSTSKRTLANIRQNFLFAMIYNISIIPLAVSGLLHPWMAGTAMALSSVSVVSNALRLKYKLEKGKEGRMNAVGA